MAYDLVHTIIYVAIVLIVLVVVILLIDRYLLMDLPLYAYAIEDDNILEDDLENILKDRYESELQRICSQQSLDVNCQSA